jgi:hypothetical protein
VVPISRVGTVPIADKVLGATCENVNMEPIHGRLKTHRRTLVLSGSRYTVLSPRPSVAARFATNRYHETWHIVTDMSGAHLLARLCWAMAFQRHPRTVIVIDPPLLAPNPHDGDPPLPIVVVNDDLGLFDREAATALRVALPFETVSEGTVALQTRGLDVALNNPEEFAQSDDQAGWRDAHQERRWIDASDGLLVIASPPPVLRAWGVDLGSRTGLGSNWSHPDDPQEDGEVQVLEHFSSQVEKAVEERDRLFPGRSGEQLSEDERRQVRALVNHGERP